MSVKDTKSKEYDLIKSTLEKDVVNVPDPTLVQRKIDSILGKPLLDWYLPDTSGAVAGSLETGPIFSNLLSAQNQSDILNFRGNPKSAYVGLTPSDIEWLKTPPGAEVNNTKQRNDLGLNNNEVEQVIEIFDYLNTSDINEESLFELFNEWQSNKTKSIKKFLLSVILIFSLSLATGVNITDLPLLKQTTGESAIITPVLFLIILFLFIIISFVYYEINLRNDERIKNAKIKRISGELKVAEIFVIQIEELILKYGLDNIEELHRKLKKGTLSEKIKSSPAVAYNAVHLFMQDLSKAKITNDFTDKLELTVMYLLGCLSLLAVIKNLILYSFPTSSVLSIVFIGLTITLNVLLAIQLRYDE